MCRRRDFDLVGIRCSSRPPPIRSAKSISSAWVRLHNTAKVGLASPRSIWLSMDFDTPDTRRQLLQRQLARFALFLKAGPIRGVFCGICTLADPVGSGIENPVYRNIPF